MSKCLESVVNFFRRTGLITSFLKHSLTHANTATGIQTVRFSFSRWAGKATIRLQIVQPVGVGRWVEPERGATVPRVAPAGVRRGCSGGAHVQGDQLAVLHPLRLLCRPCLGHASAGAAHAPHSAQVSAPLGVTQLNSIICIQYVF